MSENSFALLFGEKGRLFCEKMFSFYHRFPHLLKKAPLREMGCFISQCSETFLSSRSVFQLCRIFLSLHRLSQTSPLFLGERGRISFKKFPINSSVCGVAIALHSQQESEIFNDKQILKALQNLIPGIIPVYNSYFSYTYKTITYYYMEIKKIRGRGFSWEEKCTLKKELLHEFQKGIESSSHSLFLPGNEEELFKNIRHLSQEIRSVRDLPQVMITFTEYSNDTLKFLVIALRAVSAKTPSLGTLSANLPSLVEFTLERVFSMGRLRKKYPKEASIFTLQVKSSLFLRNNHVLNLRAARLYIVKAIEGMLGPFRDYNGGLLNKENEQLLAIKRALQAQGKGDFPFLEDLFYGIKPIDMRAVLTPETGIKLAEGFQKIALTPLESEKKYALSFFSSQGLRLALLKTQEKLWKSILPARILAHSLQIGCSVLEWEGYLYFCFFHQYAHNDLLFEALHHELAQEASLSTYPRRTVLNLNFQSGDPLSLNPRFAADMPCHILSNLLFEGLTRIARNGGVEPAAAEKIERLSDGKTYRFNLRQSWWSNGEEVSAYHFEKAWKKGIMATITGCPFPDFFYLFKNAQKARERQIPLDAVGIVVKDAKTLIVTLEEPCSYFLDLLSTPPFFPVLGEGEEPSDFNGPFTVAEWNRNRDLHLSQNPFYREQQHIKLGGIKISMIRDPYLAYEKFQKGELDFLGDPISPLPPEILKRSEVSPSLIQKQISRIFWIHCNTRIVPLQNRHLRRALSLALNRRQIVEKVLIGQSPQLSPLPAKYAQFKGLEEGDPDKACHHFHHALKELNMKKEDFPTLLLTHSDLSFEQPLFEELKRQWNSVLGIKLAPRHLRWNEFSAALEKGNFELCGLYRRDFFNNALFYLNFFKKTPQNPHSLSSKEYATLLSQFCKNEDILSKIEHLLIQESPVIPLVNQRYLALISPHIRRLDWDENGCLDLKNSYLAEADDLSFLPAI